VLALVFADAGFGFGFGIPATGAGLGLGLGRGLGVFKASLALVFDGLCERDRIAEAILDITESLDCRIGVPTEARVVTLLAPDLIFAVTLELVLVFVFFLSVFVATRGGFIGLGGGIFLAGGVFWVF